MKVADYKLNIRSRQITYTLTEVEIGGRWFSVDHLLNIIQSIEDHEDINIDDATVDALGLHNAVKWSNSLGLYCKDIGFEEFKRLLHRTIE